jgi:hypothetical protein
VRQLCWVAWSARHCVAEKECTGQSRGGSCGRYAGMVLGASRNEIQCGRGGVVLGGVDYAALRVVCTELRGIMRMCCGQ